MVDVVVAKGVVVVDVVVEGMMIVVDVDGVVVVVEEVVVGAVVVVVVLEVVVVGGSVVVMVVHVVVVVVGAAVVVVVLVVEVVLTGSVPSTNTRHKRTTPRANNTRMVAISQALWSLHNNNLALSISSHALSRAHLNPVAHNQASLSSSSFFTSLSSRLFTANHPVVIADAATAAVATTGVNHPAVTRMIHSRIDCIQHHIPHDRHPDILSCT